MAEKSNIEWTEATWNPWYGCLKVSPGCKFCYMYREMERYGRDPRVVTRSKTKFEDPLTWVRTGKAPKFCFTCSWSDFFIAEADEWRAEAWEIIRKTPQITYQILTKRPERIREHLPADWGLSGYPNVWLGVSAENQEYADERVHQLLAIPAAIHWVSAEPLLGPIDFNALTVDYSHPRHTPLHASALHRETDGNFYQMNRLLDWIVVGGESGPESRPMEAAWAKQIAQDCAESETQLFMKQMGGKGDKRGDLEDIPEDLRIRQYPEVASEA